MSSIIEIIKKRHSVRNYKDIPLEKETILSLIEAARFSPSACNAQPWRFIVVTDKKLLNEIVKRGLGGAVPNQWAVSAPAIIVGCAQLNLLTHRIGEAVKGIHYHQIDLAIAMEHIVLQSTEMGLGTCWIGWFKEKQIKNILNIPKGWKIIALLTIGYPQDKPGNQTPAPRLDTDKIVFFNTVTEK